MDLIIDILRLLRDELNELLEAVRVIIELVELYNK